MNAVSSRLLLACVSAGIVTFAVGCGSPVSAREEGAGASGGGMAADLGGGASSAPRGGASAGAECQTLACANGLRDPGESDVDCGGCCGPCARGLKCDGNADCDLALCLGGTCRAQSCFDGILNQDETDMDCGGLSGCPRCGTAQHCTSTSDCGNAECSKGTCLAASCADGMQNNAETGTDCGGGTCSPCADGQICKQSSDCMSQICLMATHTCAVPSCTDGIKNGGEPTTDCGAACASKCQLADACASASDCISGACSSGNCVPTGKPIASTAWVASASAVISPTTALQALDGDPNTCWTGGAQIPGMWFEIDMVKPQAFYGIEVRTLSVPDFGRTMRLSASLDGIQFVVLDTNIVGEPDLKIAFPTQQHARFIKLELLDSAGGLWWRIDDLYVLQ
jgi:hypothetical protein